MWWATYEFIKTKLAESKLPLLQRFTSVSPDDMGDAVVVHASAGFTAGIASSIITNPLDIVKTRLQTQDASTKHPRFTGSADALRSLFFHEGGRAMFRGLYVPAGFD